MIKGSRDRQVPPTIRRPPTGPPGPDTTLQCWGFTLEEPTAAARESENEVAAWGFAEDGRVMVCSEMGVLGFAPAKESAEMLAALRGGGTLRGRVIKQEAELCLFR
jgi:hypothetical protein